MAQHTFSTVRGKRLRVTELDECGGVSDKSNMITSDGFISVTISPETEDGSEIIVKNANGDICINEIGNPSFKYFTVEIEFCRVNPALLAIMTNADEYLDYAGDLSGFTVPEGTLSGAFALELWLGMSGQGCLSGNSGEASAYMLLPYVSQGVLGELEINGEDAITFKMTASVTKGGNTWGVGPYNVMLKEDGTPAKLPTAIDPLDHLLLSDTGYAPPAVTADPMTVAEWNKLVTNPAPTPDPAPADHSPANPDAPAE